MKDETVGGLKSAMEHGASLEQATQSFINAGYNAVEVREAAKELSSGVSQIVHPPQGESKHDLPSIPQKEGAPMAPPGNENVGSKKGTGKTALLIVLIIVLLGVLGGIGWMVYEFLK